MQTVLTHIISQLSKVGLCSCSCHHIHVKNQTVNIITSSRVHKSVSSPFSLLFHVSTKLSKLSRTTNSLKQPVNCNQVPALWATSSAVYHQTCLLSEMSNEFPCLAIGPMATFLHNAGMEGYPSLAMQCASHKLTPPSDIRCPQFYTPGRIAISQANPRKQGPAMNPYRSNIRTPK